MSLVLGVVDDESTIRILREIVDSIGFELILADSTSPEFPDPDKRPISLVIFDVDDSQNIYDVCHNFRPSCRIPAIVLVNEGSEQRIPEFLSAGATDCVVKPLRMAELTARILAALEDKDHNEATQLPIFRCKSLTVNPVAGKVFKNGNELSITPIGFRLLVYFMQHKSEVVTKEQLLRDVWGHTGGFSDANLVDSAIRRLRKDIGDDAANPECLRTIWGVGYRFEEQRKSAKPSVNLS